MKTIEELANEVLGEFRVSKLSLTKFRNSFNDKINETLKEYGHINNIPPDHEYWDIKSKVSLFKKMEAEGALDLLVDQTPKTRKQTYQLLKYGLPKDRIKRVTENAKETIRNEVILDDLNDATRNP